MKTLIIYSKEVISCRQKLGNIGIYGYNYMKKVSYIYTQFNCSLISTKRMKSVLNTVKSRDSR